MAIVAPSLLSANFLHLKEEINLLQTSKAEWLHLDVMDGRFVPNISFGFPVLDAIKGQTDLLLDVHLMIVEPDLYIRRFAASGADQLTVHWEACPHLHRSIQQIHQEKMKAGVAINPHTPISFLQDVIGELDLVNIMSVNPGFGGQKFILHTLKKIEELKTLIVKANSHALIEIDGGVTLENAADIINAGADVLVAGNTVFRSPDPQATINELSAF